MKQKPKKKIMTIEDLYKPDPKEKQYLDNKTAVDSARGSEKTEEQIKKLKLRVGNYSLRDNIINNPWTKSNPQTAAAKWLMNTVFKAPEIYRYDKQLLEQGNLFIFEYHEPKYKDTPQLPWFDKYPLVVSLGPKVTALGPRNIGFNLHFLPPKIRIVVVCAIFEMYKKLYRYQIFYGRNTPILIHYKQIVKALENYGVKFSIRMYIPTLMRNIVKFPIMDWDRAVFIPSRGFHGITAQKVIQAWQKYNRRMGHSTRTEINWKSLI